MHVVGPDDILRNPRLLFSFHIPVANVGESKGAVAVFAEDFGDRATYGPEANQRQTAHARAFVAVFGGSRWGWFGWRFRQSLQLADKTDSLSYVCREVFVNRAWSGAGDGAGGTGIKVGNMVPACCECNPGGSIADAFFSKAPLIAEGRAEVGPSAAVRHHAWQQEENE